MPWIRFNVKEPKYGDGPKGDYEVSQEVLEDLQRFLRGEMVLSEPRFRELNGFLEAVKVDRDRPRNHRQWAVIRWLQRHAKRYQPPGPDLNIFFTW